MLDVAIDPDFPSNRFVYLSFSEPAGKQSGTTVFRARFDESKLSDGKVIFRQEPKVPSSLHFGSRLVFARDGNLFVTMGD
jgi:glucose/arabinose dehydrogenase